MTTTKKLAPFLLALATAGACQHSSDTDASTEAPGTQRVLVVPAQDVLQVAADEDAARREREAQTPVEATTEPAPEPTAPLVTEADRAFLRDAMLDAQIAIALGETALQYAERDDVKAFARMMVDDHTAASMQLAQLAGELNVMLPADSNDRLARRRADLAQWHGPRFDRVYTERMVAAHVEAVEEVRLVANSGTQPELRSWAEKTLPTLEEHLQHAQKLLSDIPTEPVARR